MAARRRTAVLISGRGSNLRALIEACARPDASAEIVLVIVLGGTIAFLWR